jgi:hypothetical protein
VGEPVGAGEPEPEPWRDGHLIGMTDSEPDTWLESDQAVADARLVLGEDAGAGERSPAAPSGEVALRRDPFRGSADDPGAPGEGAPPAAEAGGAPPAPLDPDLHADLHPDPLARSGAPAEEGGAPEGGLDPLPLHDRDADAAEEGGARATPTGEPGIEGPGVVGPPEGPQAPDLAAGDDGV